MFQDKSYLKRRMRLDCWKKKRDVMRHYNQIADAYDSLYEVEQIRKIELALKFVHLSASDLILDVGCGTGILLKYLRDNSGFFVGVDLSLRLLKIAAHYSSLRKKAHACLICADACFLPFRGEVFDKVFAFTLMQNIPELSTAVREMVRVAKRNSWLTITGLKKNFSVEDFGKVLDEAGLKFSIVDFGEQTKDIIAVGCKTYG
jgi:ubiquinone/menaquinone biosynthesis C-methylase UbiE